MLVGPGGDLGPRTVFSSVIVNDIWLGVWPRDVNRMARGYQAAVTDRHRLHLG